LLLTLATPRKDLQGSRQACSEKVQTLRACWKPTPRELQDVPGIGPNNMLGIKLIKAVSERFLAKKVIGKSVIANSRDLCTYLNGAIRDKTRECFMADILRFEKPRDRHGHAFRRHP